MYKTIKFILTAACVCLISASALAETDYVALKKIKKLKAGTESLGTPLMDAATVNGTATVGEPKEDGKMGVVGTDAVTGMMVDFQDITATAATLQTNAFTTAFETAPVVTAVYTEDPGDVKPIFVVSVSTTAVVLSITADKDYNLIAVGRRP